MGVEIEFRAQLEGGTAPDSLTVHLTRMEVRLLISRLLKEIRDDDSPILQLEIEGTMEYQGDVITEKKSASQT